MIEDYDYYTSKLGHNRSRGDLFKNGKEKIENLIKSRDETRKNLEFDPSLPTYKRAVTDIKQLQEQFTRILYYKPKN